MRLAELTLPLLETHIDAFEVSDCGATVRLFPALDPACWRERSREHFGPAGGRSFSFDFVRYEAVAPRDPPAYPGGPDGQ